MAQATTQRDPRSIVTPDAFELSEGLLGLQLASPRRRLAAMLIDLLVIGFVTTVTRSFALVLGVVAAGFFVRAGFKRTPVRGSVFGRAMRFSVGCLGLFIALVTAVVWSSCGIDFQGGGDEPEAPTPPAFEATGAAGRIVGAITTAGARSAFQDAETLQEAEDVAAGLVEAGLELGIDSAALHAMLSDAVPAGASWADEAVPMLNRLLGVPPGARSALADAIEAEVADLTVPEALSAYGAALGSEEEDEGEERRLRRTALRARLAEAVAADTIGRLADRIEELERTNRSQRGDLEEARAALADATSGGIFGWLRDFVDELGFGFGWASLYLTIFLSWWNGQTIGKKAMGIRVMRLDGDPITWWIAFERAGGYAAGFATGLLGFAQVFWDANRQAIHDRIVGTVVVREGVERVTDWESAL